VGPRNCLASKHPEIVALCLTAGRRKPLQAGVYDALMHARDRLEAITWRVEGIALAERGEPPKPVTLAEIGTVAVIVDNAERMAGDIAQFAARLRDSIGGLSALQDTSETGISTAANG
jgi:hypothetical protein